MSTAPRVATTALALALVLAFLPNGAMASAERSTPGGPPPRTVVPTQLKRGPDAAIDFMLDGVVHTVDGRRIAIRTPANRNQRQLLGKSKRGWLVAVRKGNRSKVVAVRRGHKPVTMPRTSAVSYGAGDSAVGWRLSRDGKMLLSTTYDRGGSNTGVLSLAGKWLDSFDNYDEYVTPFDADAGHVVIYRENEFGRLRVFDWVPKGRGTELVKEAAYVSMPQDLIFTHTTGRRYGPTSISAPGEPAWAREFQPLSVSPNGQTAIGLRIPKSTFDNPAILDVRRMGDGALLDSIAYGPRITMDDWDIGKSHEQTARWETNFRYVFQMGTRRGAVLVRCRLSRSCQRASDYGSDISTPFESFMWW